MFFVTKSMLWKMTVRIHIRIKNLHSIPQMSETEEKILYGHFVIFIGLINIVFKEVSEAFIHNIFVKI